MFSIYFIKLRYNLPGGQLGLDCGVRLRRKETRRHRVRIIFYAFLVLVASYIIDGNGVAS